MWRFGISVALLLALTGCVGGGPPPAPTRVASMASLPLEKGLPPQIQCVPFVREISGLQLFGDAWSWWDQAAGRYQRGNRPQENGVLVLRATKQLPNGHVAMVNKIINPREITVTHANWGTEEVTRRMIHNAMPVIDVSPANDWSQLRFWNTTTQGYGKVYEAYGFILPKLTLAEYQPVW